MFLSDGRDKALTGTKLWGRRAANGAEREKGTEWAVSHNQLQPDTFLHVCTLSCLHTDSGQEDNFPLLALGTEPRTQTHSLTERSCPGKCDYIFAHFQLLEDFMGGFVSPRGNGDVWFLSQLRSIYGTALSFDFWMLGKFKFFKALKFWKSGKQKKTFQIPRFLNVITRNAKTK